MALEGHEQSPFRTQDGADVFSPTISYFSDGQQIMSGFWDNTVRLWDLRTGKEIEKAPIANSERGTNNYGVCSFKASRYIFTCSGPEGPEVCEVKKGIVKSFQCYSTLTCIDPHGQQAGGDRIKGWYSAHMELRHWQTRGWFIQMC